MALRFKKDEHRLISDAVRAYIKHLELIECNKFDYLGELRNFLGKLLRESDWSYILWTSPKSDLSGRIKILKSSSTDFPRNSKWTLFQDGKLRLISIFKSRELNLAEFLVELKTITEQTTSAVKTFCLVLSLKNSEFIEIETSSSALTTLKELEILIKDSAFKERVTPSLIMLDSIQFYLENKPNDKKLSQTLLRIRDQLIKESYGIKPAYIKRNVLPAAENEDTDAIKLKINSASLILLENVLSEYCQIVEKYIPPELIDYDKLDKARLLAEKFRQSIK